MMSDKSYKTNTRNQQRKTHVQTKLDKPSEGLEESQTLLDLHHAALLWLRIILLGLLKKQSNHKTWNHWENGELLGQHASPNQKKHGIFGNRSLKTLIHLHLTKSEL